MRLIFRSNEEYEQEIILRFRDGGSIRSIGREFGISRNTVRRILRKHDEKRENGEKDLIKKTFASKLDSFKLIIAKIIEESPDITGQRIFEKLKDQGYSGGITILRDHLQKIRIIEQEPVIRFETEPGLQSQMDWSSYTIHFKRIGKMIVQCFSYILCFSRRHYIDFSLKHDFFTLIRRHQDTFIYFGGVTKECLYDNEKTVVLRWEGGKPVYNPRFTAFITHYNCRPKACKPRSPQTKGKVEAPFRYIERNLLSGREFQDIEDLRQTARWWLTEISDKHIHNTTKRAPIERFMEEEQAALQPLPAFPYDSSEVRLVVCRSDGLVQFETNRYSVPTGHIADILSLKATEKEIRIYSSDLKLLATHERQSAGSNITLENPAHHRAKRDCYGLEPVKEAFLALGNASEEFLKGLKEKNPKNCGFHARHILALKNDYLSDDIDKALAHALKYQAFDGKAIGRILNAGFERRTLESIRNEQAHQELKKTLPAIRQRSLDEYSNLLETKEKKDVSTTGNTDENKESPSNTGFEESDGKS